MKVVNLTDVYTMRASGLPAVAFLYELLHERVKEPENNISHKEVPTFDQHRNFVDSMPYKVWYIVHMNNKRIGAIYLSHQNEIGIYLKNEYRGHGYGKQAIYLLMKMHPEKQYLANIAPGNIRSMAMFEKLGFELLQFTLSKEP